MEWQDCGVYIETDVVLLPITASSWVLQNLVPVIGCGGEKKGDVRHVLKRQGVGFHALFPNFQGAWIEGINPSSIILVSSSLHSASLSCDPKRYAEGSWRSVWRVVQNT
jgi:hypothetical protein